jgi:hypothetical protein
MAGAMGAAARGAIEAGERAGGGRGATTVGSRGEGLIAGTYTQAISLKSQVPTPHNWSLIACHAESGGQLNR